MSEIYSPVYYPLKGPILVKFVQLVEEVNPNVPVVIIQESSKGKLWNDLAPVPPQTWKTKKGGD
jgi:hypothetical protein